jgi:hypothetical protein
MALKHLDNFAFVTVMNVEVYPGGTKFVNDGETGFENKPLLPKKADGTTNQDRIALLDSLTMSNITQEGPVKQARGGIRAEPIIRFRKTIRVEMEDVVAKVDSLNALFAAKLTPGEDGKYTGFTITDEFATMLALRGTTYIIDKTTGERQWVEIIFNRFLPDSVFEMMLEAEGDIGMMNVAGELFPNDCGDYFEVRRIDALTPLDCELPEEEVGE